MNQTVDNYLVEGCGRCPLGGTPECKALHWTAELELLRAIALDCQLKEESKWGVPCYTSGGKNVILISAFKDYCVISFFKGSLLTDPKNILAKPGENSQAGRMLKFTDTERIIELEDDIKDLIREAIQVEKSGLKVKFKKNPEPIPEELEHKFKQDPLFKSAFYSLTPGRQRGYIIHFSQPKQSATRAGRIERCIPKILNGEGMHDKYKSMKKKG
ncbi:MAG: DUF1801 domain-containing protein [Bacteroidota bacterium]